MARRSSLSKQTFFDIRMPEDIERNMRGGPEFNTVVTPLDSGAEQRNIKYSQPRYKWDVAYGVMSIQDDETREMSIERVQAFFAIVQGRAIGFRFKDWSDYCLFAQVMAVENGITVPPNSLSLSVEDTEGLYHFRTDNNEDVYMPSPKIVEMRQVNGSFNLTGLTQKEKDVIMTLPGSWTVISKPIQIYKRYHFGDMNSYGYYDREITRPVEYPNTSDYHWKVWFTTKNPDIDADSKMLKSGVDQLQEGTDYVLNRNTGKVVLNLGGISPTFDTSSTTPRQLIVETEFDVPVRFDTDYLEMETIHAAGHGAASISSLSIIELKE